MKLIYSAFFGFFFLFYVPLSIAEDVESILYSLILPDIVLNKENSQSIEEINFKVACGHIEAISYIPELWNVNIVRGASVIEEFSASSGLGAANLQFAQYKKMQKAIIISTIKECKNLLNISGSVIVSAQRYLKLN